MVKRNISLYETKKDIIKKSWICTKGKAHITNFSDKGNVDAMDFWE